MASDPDKPLVSIYVRSDMADRGTALADKHAGIVERFQG